MVDKVREEVSQNVLLVKSSNKGLIIFSKFTIFQSQRNSLESSSCLEAIDELLDLELLDDLEDLVVDLEDLVADLEDLVADLEDLVASLEDLVASLEDFSR